MRKDYKLGIVGATGAVGREMIRLLQQRSFPLGELRLIASARSAGKTLTVEGQTYPVTGIQEGVFSGLDILLMSAGASVSRTWAPQARDCGCLVIDNSSAFRLEPDVPLIVPEINPEALGAHRGLIANPNCTTAIVLMGLFPLHRAFGLKHFFAATYQAVSGSGAAAMTELEQQVRDWAADKPPVASVYPHPIAFNLLPHVDTFLEDGYTKEEHKLVNESRKILSYPQLKVSTTCVRVPVLRTHAVALHAAFERSVNLDQARSAIADFSGAELCDEPSANRYPMPLDYVQKGPCGVGRLRSDTVFTNGLALWVVGDQLWKGAALNAIQIAELAIRQKVL